MLNVYIEHHGSIYVDRPATPGAREPREDHEVREWMAARNPLQDVVRQAFGVKPGDEKKDEQ